MASFACSSFTAVRSSTDSPHQIHSSGEPAWRCGGQCPASIIEFLWQKALKPRRGIDSKDSARVTEFCTTQSSTQRSSPICSLSRFIEAAVSINANCVRTYKVRGTPSRASEPR